MATRKEVGEHLDALRRQEGGTHYRDYAIQPVEYIVANKIGFLAGNVIKYATRYKDKNGAQDIRKAIHYLELILEFEYPERPMVQSSFGGEYLYATSKSRRYGTGFAASRKRLCAASSGAATPANAASARRGARSRLRKRPHGDDSASHRGP